MKYSTTLAGVLVSVLGSLFVSWGFSEACSSEIVAWVPVILGGAISWFGRVKAGGVNVLGFK